MLAELAYGHALTPADPSTPVRLRLSKSAARCNINARVTLRAAPIGAEVSLYVVERREGGAANESRIIHSVLGRLMKNADGRIVEVEA